MGLFVVAGAERDVQGGDCAKDEQDQDDEDLWRGDGLKEGGEG